MLYRRVGSKLPRTKREKSKEMVLHEEDCNRETHTYGTDSGARSTSFCDAKQ